MPPTAQALRARAREAISAYQTPTGLEFPGVSVPTMAEWWFRGELIETCNCAPFGCPCNYTALPTNGDCRSVAAYRIDEGAFGPTWLDGLAFGMLYSWPGPIHEGNGRAVVYVDERASEAQREAIGRVGRGEAGEGGPFAIFATTYAEPATVVGGPIEPSVARPTPTASPSGTRTPGVCSPRSPTTSEGSKMRGSAMWASHLGTYDPSGCAACASR